MTACPSCGAGTPADAAFCEACGAELTPGAAAAGAPSGAPTQVVAAAATPVTSTTGDESPLDVGWTGALPRATVTEPATPTAGAAGAAEPMAAAATAPAAGAVGAAEPMAAPVPAGPECQACHQGHLVDGYCDVCGAPPRDPRDHFTESPAPWVAGACDIGKRHTRNEDGLALLADPTPGTRAVLVVCDGVSNTTDSHIASLAAARAAREVLAAPLPQGMGTRESRVAALSSALGEAVKAADAAVEGAVPAGTENPPSSTVVAVVIDAGLAVAGNVGDSRAYWLPDVGDPLQLSTDDSWAAEMIRAGASRADAESGPRAHEITRWLGVDAPDDLTPHCADLDLDTPGWLLVCSDGLWNYCSEAMALRDLLASTLTGLGPAPVDLVAAAEALVTFANAQGGADNITVALARIDGSGSAHPPTKDTTHG